MANSILAAFRSGLKNTFFRVVLRAVMISPFKAAAISACGFILGTILLFLKGNRWGEVAGFLRRAHRPVWRDLPRYFVKRATYTIWKVYFYEDWGALRRHADSGDMARIAGMLAKGQGALVLAAHSILKSYGQLFHEHGIPVKILVNRLPDSPEHLLGYSSTRHYRAVVENLQFLIAGREEKRLVKHLLNGGAAVVYIDFPKRSRSSCATTLLGVPMEFSTFFFKMAIRHRIPLFYSFVSETAERKLRFSFIPADPFSTPEEGLSRYVPLLESWILENPGMWHFTPQFLSRERPSQSQPLL